MALKFMADRDKMYLYPWYISDLVATKDLEKIAGGRVKKALVVIVNDFLTFYYDDKSINKVGEQLFKRISKDKKFFPKIVAKIYEYSEDLMAFGEKVKKNNLKKLNDQDLFDLYAKYIKQLSVLRCWGWVPVFLDGLDKAFLTDIIQTKLKKHLKKIGLEEKTGEYYSILSSSEKASEVQKEESARLDLLIAASKHPQQGKIIRAIKLKKIKDLKNRHPEVYKKIMNHLREFGWLTYAYSGPTMQLGYLFKMLKDNLGGGSIEKQKEELVNHYRSIKKEKEKILAKISLPAELSRLLEVSSGLMFIKDYRKGVYQKSYVFMDPVMEEIARRLKMSLKHVKYLILPELKNALLKDEVVKYKKIAEVRMNKCCYLAENGKIKVYEGRGCEKILAQMIKKADAPKLELKELKGTTAYRGRVSGIVKIVLVEKDVPKVRPGDILVSSATNPDLIMAMKKAGAFVTDLGGITSHAAIVSRELKKPCVVGTKFATHVLKDGDLVEVDADNGVVKILKNLKTT